MKTQITLSTGENITTSLSYAELNEDVMSATKFIQVESESFRPGGTVKIMVLINVNHIVKITE